MKERINENKKKKNEEKKSPEGRCGVKS